jgi:hypothetical protein
LPVGFLSKNKAVFDEAVGWLIGEIHPHCSEFSGHDISRHFVVASFTSTVKPRFKKPIFLGIKVIPRPSLWLLIVDAPHNHIINLTIILVVLLVSRVSA